MVNHTFVWFLSSINKWLAIIAKNRLSNCHIFTIMWIIFWVVAVWGSSINNKWMVSALRLLLGEHCWYSSWSCICNLSSKFSLLKHKLGIIGAVHTLFVFFIMDNLARYWGVLLVLKYEAFKLFGHISLSDALVSISLIWSWLGDSVHCGINKSGKARFTQKCE